MVTHGLVAAPPTLCRGVVPRRWIAYGLPSVRILFFGTFDEGTHPRVRALREGIERHGHEVTSLDVPLGLGTGDRVRMAQRPWRAPILLFRLATCWVRLWRGGRSLRPDVVVVPYLGHFDVHLARRRFRHSTIVLDHMVSLGDTVRDRGLGETSLTARLLDAVDRAALRAADVVVVDTAAQGATLPSTPTCVVVVPVAPPTAWFATTPAPDPSRDEPVRIVFFGLFTPLQGAPDMGRALAALPRDRPVAVTMVGTGQDLADTRARVGPDERVTWVDWIDSAALPDAVAAHHICLGIFGTGPKAQRVVPNKVLQGAAAGCAIVTSDTAVQREALGDGAVYVPAGSPSGLADALTSLVTDRDRLAGQRRRAREVAVARLTPEASVGPLLEVLDRPPGSARVKP
jgi:glycosyltransferase involved in cell wall biosynthesis